MSTIWSYGYINLDIITRSVGQWPEQSGLTWVDSIEFKLGGAALNPAVAVAKLGGQPVGIIGFVGDDLGSQMIRQELVKLGLDLSQLTVRKGETSGICIVGVHPDTERSFVMAHGANAQLRRQGVPLDKLAPGDTLHFGGGSSKPQLAEVLAPAKQRQIRISMDITVESRRDGWDRLAKVLPFVDVFFANEMEAKLITELPDPIEAAHKFAAAGPDIVAIKQGPEGAYLLTPTWQGHIPGFSIEAIDTTGAGDSFAGSLLYGLAKGWSIEQAATFACAVGAMSAATAGATEGVRSYAETVAFIKQYGREKDWDWSE